MEQILNKYYADNARELHRVVDKILMNFGGISNKDVDDFYSLANEVFTDIVKKYDRNRPFEKFLYSCLSYKIKTEITARNCYKRMADRFSVSIDLPVSDDENFTIGDMLADSFNLEEEVIGKEEEGYNMKMLSYLNRLSKVQKEILKLTIAGYKPCEICEKLHISGREYSDADAAIHSYRNISLLF